jgi:tetratricopeptide (TPR) repeat protein
MHANIDLLVKGGSEESPNLEECLSQIEQLKEEGNLSGQAEVLSLVAGYHADRGRWDDAVSCYQESLQLFAAVGESFNRASVLFNLALVYKDRGDLADAAAMLREAESVFQEMGAVPCLAQVDLSLGSVLALQGRSEEANGHFEQAMARQEALEALPDLCESCLTRALFLAGEGRLVEAEFYLGRGEGLISRADCQPLNALHHLVEGEIHLRRGRAREAKSSFEKALSLARRTENPHQEAKALAGMGRVALEQKEKDLAEAHLSQALSICRALGAKGDALRLCRSLQQLFLSQGDLHRAQEMASLQLQNDENIRQESNASAAQRPVAAAVRIFLAPEEKSCD